MYLKKKKLKLNKYLYIINEVEIIKKKLTIVGLKKYLDGDSGALKRSIKFNTSDHTPITSSSTLNPGANDSSDNRNNIVFVELDLYTKSLQKNIYIHF